MNGDTVNGVPCACPKCYCWWIWRNTSVAILINFHSTLDLGSAMSWIGTSIHVLPCLQWDFWDCKFVPYIFLVLCSPNPLKNFCLGFGVTHFTNFKAFDPLIISFSSLLLETGLNDFQHNACGRVVVWVTFLTSWRCNMHDILRECDLFLDLTLVVQSGAQRHIIIILYLRELWQVDVRSSRLRTMPLLQPVSSSHLSQYSLGHYLFPVVLKYCITNPRWVH